MIDYKWLLRLIASAVEKQISKRRVVFAWDMFVCQLNNMVQDNDKVCVIYCNVLGQVHIRKDVVQGICLY